MVDVSNKQNSVVITVAGSNGNTNVTAKSDTAQYWSNASKKYSEDAKISANLAEQAKNEVIAQKDSVINDIEGVRAGAVESVTEIKDQAVSDVTALVNDGVTNVETIKNNAIKEVTTAQSNSLQAIKDKGDDIIADIEENGKSLPMFTPLWTDHIYNDASYLRADTFSWQNAEIYVTGYEILEQEYNNEECTIEVESGVTYKLSPNGFKIADASQNDTIASLYENDKAWFYVIDTENRKFKLPREKSNEHKYLYFYVGNYSRPDTEINLGILAELANSQDLDSVLASINEVKDNGIAELEATTASGVVSVAAKTSTGLNEITTSTTAGVATINDTTNAGKAEIQNIIANGIPTATLETAGIVRPDGETITIVDGVISAAGGGGDYSIVEAYVNGTNGYNLYANDYCEQWGSINAVQAGSAVTLLKAYKDTNYTIQTSMLAPNTTASKCYAACFYSVKTTSFTVFAQSIENMMIMRTAGTVHWRACGYIS